MGYKQYHRAGPCDITLEIPDDLSKRFVDGSEREEIQQEWSKNRPSSKTANCSSKASK